MNKQDVKRSLLGKTGAGTHFLVYDSLLELSKIDKTYELQYTQEEIGKMLKMTRQSIKKSLEALEDIGAVMTKSKLIVVLGEEV